MRIKICGINSTDALAAAADAGADYVGFVFFPPSPRFVTPVEAAAIRAARPAGPPAVGLFVKPTLDEIAAVLATARLDVLQSTATPRWRAPSVRDSDCRCGGQPACPPAPISPRPSARPRVSTVW